MYWLLKMCKTPISARFIVAPKSCNTKPMCKKVQKNYRKSLFCTCFKKFFVVENSFPIVTKLNKINTKKKAKSISNFDFTKLYLTIPHDFLIKILSEVIKLFSNEKLKVSLALQKHQSTGHERVVEEDTSQGKI